MLANQKVKMASWGPTLLQRVQSPLKGHFQKAAHTWANSSLSPVSCLKGDT